MGAGQLGEETENRPVTVRTFFGLPLPDGHRNALDSYLSECAAGAPEFRWTPAANLHLTIRFLGQVELALAEGIADRLAGKSPRAFDLQLGEMGTFKRGRLTRVVWIGLGRGSDEIAALAAEVDTECGLAGLEPEGRRYHAHLTLARARPRDGAVLPVLPAPPELPAWRADELILYRSRLGRAASVYEPLRRVSLG